MNNDEQISYYELVKCLMIYDSAFFCRELINKYLSHKKNTPK